jgi:hypothetical protein
MQRINQSTWRHALKRRKGLSRHLQGKHRGRHKRGPSEPSPEVSNCSHEPPSISDPLRPLPAVHQELALVERAEVRRQRLPSRMTPSSLLSAGPVTDTVFENCSAA